MAVELGRVEQRAFGRAVDVAADVYNAVERQRLGLLEQGPRLLHPGQRRPDAVRAVEKGA